MQQVASAKAVQQAELIDGTLSHGLHDEAQRSLAVAGDRKLNQAQQT